MVKVTLRLEEVGFHRGMAKACDDGMIHWILTLPAWLSEARRRMSTSYGMPINANKEQTSYAALIIENCANKPQCEERRNLHRLAQGRSGARNLFQSPRLRGTAPESGLGMVGGGPGVGRESSDEVNAPFKMFRVLRSLAGDLRFKGHVAVDIEPLHVAEAVTAERRRKFPWNRLCDVLSRV